MWLLNISFHYSFCSSGEAFHETLEPGCGNLLFFSHKSLWVPMLGDKAGLAVDFPVMALCRTVNLLHTKLRKPFFLWTYLAHRGSVMLEYERAFTAKLEALFYKTSLYAAALKFPLIWTKGGKPKIWKTATRVIICIHNEYVIFYNHCNILPSQTSRPNDMRSLVPTVSEK